MLRTLSTRHVRRRSGAVLIVVLAMLVLFAVLGLSFVLYSEAQLSITTSAKDAVNIESPPDALASAERWIGPFITGHNNVGEDLANPTRGHDLTRSKFGFVFDPATGAFVPTYLPYGAANAMQAEPVGFNFNGITNSREIVRHTWDQPSAQVFDPEWFYNTMPLRNNPNTNLAAANGSYQAKNYPFTYPDRHDFYLAQMDPATGRITVPSFHRPELGSWDPTSVAPNPVPFESQGAAGKFRTLRPRAVEHPNFPAVPMDPDGVYRADVSNMKFISAAGGQQNDSFWMYAGGPVLHWKGKYYTACVAPLILDLNSRVNLSVVGNVKNTNAATTGLFPHGSKEGWGPWEINPRWIGNINPATLAATDNTNFTDADLTALVTRRHGGTANPPVDPYTAQAFTTRINRGQMPWQGAMFNVDGDGPTMNDGPLNLPPSGTYLTTPIFNNPAAVGPFRFSPTQADVTARLANHQAQYNPLVYTRPPSTTAVLPAIGAGSYGHNEGVNWYARYSDPKNRQTAVTGLPNTTSLTPATDTAIARQMRALTTTFSTSQQWAGVTVRATTTAQAAASGVTFPTPPPFTESPRLGPIDLNRPLPDYRKNPLFPASPLNLWNPSVAAELPYWTAAHSARQRLARDIFVRMAARYGLINGTTAIYYTDTGHVEVFPDPATDTSGNVAVLMRLAQMAVNLVDYIDGDDIVTPFIWRPTHSSAMLADPILDVTPTGNNFAVADTASRVVYGTEMPRLVLNEVYGGVFNDRRDPAAPLPLPHAMHPLKRRYWIELYNPTPSDVTRSDGGAARLRYQPGATPSMIPDASGTSVAYTGADYNPYRIEVAVAPVTAAPAVANPYALALSLTNTAGGYGLAAGDTVAALGASASVKARIDNFTPTTTTPPGPNAALPGDTVNLVLPATGLTGTPAGNIGYYLIGPEDQFPATPAVTNSLSLPDAAAGVPPLGTPPLPVNALSFDATAGAPTDAEINGANGETNKPSTVILRRLLNPYMPPNDPQNTGGTLDARFPYNSALPPNPYITVDFLENLPTRDRATHNNVSTHTATNTDAPSAGRIHPFAAYPDYGTAVTAPQVAAVQDQVNAGVTAGPPHTFFGINNPADNARGTVAPNQTGFEWLVHLDRELTSLPEAALASRTSPALLTHTFIHSNVGVANLYHGHAVKLSERTLNERNQQMQVTINSQIDYIRMLTDSEGLLRVGSRLPGVPVGGREPGKVNINTVNDVRVLQAVLDPQGGNVFTSGYTTGPTGRWNYLQPGTPPAMNIARTPNGTPRATIHEGGTDYPLVMGSTTWGPTTPAYDAVPPRDHPFGRRTVDDVANLTAPTVFPNDSAPPVMTTGASHPYLLNEPLQKAWNNLTPVSDSFLIVMTVGFFEVDNAGPWNVTNQPQLGKELFDKVPGDLRVQFGGIIDRSQLFTQIVQNDVTTGLALGTVQPVNSDAASNPVPRGVQTKMVNDSLVGSTTIDIEAIPPGGVRPDGTTVAAGTCAILGDGVVYTVGANSIIRIGHGGDAPNGDGEWLTVSAVTQRQWPDQNLALQNVPGQVTLTVSAATRGHSAGSPVGNVLFGNPGPQPGVRLTDLQRRGVVPYFTRLEP